LNSSLEEGNKLTLQNFPNQHFVKKIPDLGNDSYKVNKTIFKGEGPSFSHAKIYKNQGPSFHIVHMNICVLMMFVVWYRWIHEPGGKIMFEEVVFERW